MPRKARKDINSEFLHIMVQGLNKEYIFNEEKDIEKYLGLISENIGKFNLEIIAYCIMNNHVHLLTFSEDTSEVTKFMQKINTKYAMNYNKCHNRCGYVFRNRYKAEEIYTRAHLLSCINYIHNNPVKAGMCKEKSEYKYSSYNDYLERKKFNNNNFIEKCLKKYGIDYNLILNNNYKGFKFIESEDFDEKDKEKIIKEYFEKENLKLEQLKKDKESLKKIVIELNIEYNLTQKEISEKLEISKTKVNRIIRSRISK